MLRVWAAILFIFAESLNVNASGASPSNCQRLSTINYHYSSPYRLSDLDVDKDTEGISFNFSVQAVSDGHIRLASTSDAKMSPVTLEIIIGAGGNTFSTVRRRPKKFAVDYTTTTYGILTDKEFRAFTLTLKEETLVLYANNSDIPILVYEDPAVVDVEYLSFGAWNNVVVEWAFDCREIEILEPPVDDPYDKLKKIYAAQNSLSPFFSDNGTVMINITMNIVHIHLDAKTSRFTLRMLVDQRWTDPIKRWNPEDYGNITQLKFEYWEVKYPWLELFDVPTTSGRYDRPFGWKFRLNSDGEVKFHAEMNIKTFCDIDAANWPLDSHTCEVRLGFDLTQNNIGVDMVSIRQELDTTALEWEIQSIMLSKVTEVGAPVPRSFIMRIALRRLGGSYVLLFVMPLFAAFIMLIASFVIAPKHKTRLALVSASVVTLNLLLYMEDSLLPAHPGSSPRILKTTSCLLIVAMLQLVFHCFNVHVANFEIPPPRFVKAVARKPWMKHLHQATYDMFLLDDKDAADELNETVADTDVLNSEEPPEGINMNKYHWALVSRCLDMLNFTISFLVLPFILAPI